MDLTDVTDIHLSVSQPETSVIFPGPYRVPPEMLDQVHSLLNLCKSQQESRVRDDFMVAYNDFRFRGRLCQRALDGVWFRLRKLQQDTPFLDNLPSPLAPALVKLLVSPSLSRGGLVLIAGSPGSGKTTTASSIVATRLTMFGGFAYTIEDPPEMPLNGWYSDNAEENPTIGFCTQNTISDKGDDPWGEAIREALRSQPAGSRSILYIGEVRDARCARAMLRAASNGFLVVATCFGNDIPNALESLIRLASQGGDHDMDSLLSDLANTLRMVIHQQVVAGYMKPSFMISASSSSPAASAIRSNGIGRLKDLIESQRMRIQNREVLHFDEE